MTTLYFSCNYGRQGTVECAIGDCGAAKLITNSDGEGEMVACDKKHVPGIEFDDSEGEYGPTFICLGCLNELIRNEMIKTEDI